MGLEREQFDLNWGSREDRDVLEVIAAFKELKRKKAELEFAKIARSGGERRFLQSPSGWGGEVGMQIHSASYHYWGQRLGYQCWSDAQFVKEYLRDNPYARVKNRAAQVTVAVTATLGDTPAPKRFSKSYDLTGAKTNNNN